MRSILFSALALTLLPLASCHESIIGTVRLSGQIVLEDETPMEGVRVTIFFPDLGVEGSGGPVTRVTNSTGRYRYEYS
jgi:hypothetical protein